MAVASPVIWRPEPEAADDMTVENVTAPLAPLSSMPSPPVLSMVVVEN